MLKETGYKEKFEMLSPWLLEVVEVVKKDLKNEHLKIDKPFCKRYFLGKNLGTLSSLEMKEAYVKDVQEGNVGLGEFIATRWLLKNTDIYGYFESQLKTITTDFEALDLLDEALSNQLIATSVSQFGAKRTYLFSVFNSVVFPPKIYEKLKDLALKETAQVSEEKKQTQEAVTIETLQKKQAREMAALKDKYEKKLSGLEKKYLHDVSVLKKQVASYQKNRPLA